MRIAIDTRELRSLAAVYRQVAGDVRCRVSSVQRDADETSLNGADPRVRRAAVHERVREVARSVDVAAGALDREAASIERRAERVDLEQGGGISVWIGGLWPVLPIRWSTVGPAEGDWSGSSILGRPGRLGLVAAGGSAGLAALGHLLRRGAGVGVRSATGLVSHVLEAVRGAAGAMARQGSRVAHFTAEAWRRGVAVGRGAYRQVVEGLHGLVSRAAGVFTDALRVLRTTGRFVADTATFTWNLLKTLPGTAANAFKKVWHALVDLPVWKQVPSFVRDALALAELRFSPAPVVSYLVELVRPHREAQVFELPTDDRRPRNTDTRSFGGYVDRLEDLHSGEVEIRHIVGSHPPRYVVLLKGIDGFDDADTGTVTDLNAVWIERLGREGRWKRAVQRALEQMHLPPDAEVMLVGHSGGGIVAANLASDPEFVRKYHVTHVLTNGSGVTDKLDDIVPGGQPPLKVLMLDHNQDHISQGIQSLRSRRTGDGSDRITDHFDDSSVRGGPLGAASGHGYGYYSHELDTTERSDVQAWLASARDYLGKAESTYFEMAD